MLDPFRNIAGDKSRAFMVSPSLHIGVVKAYNNTLKTCMVLVNSINDVEPLGPLRIIAPFSTAVFSAPSVGDIVVVGCIDGNFADMVVLGTLA